MQKQLFQPSWPSNAWRVALKTSQVKTAKAPLTLFCPLFSYFFTTGSKQLTAERLPLLSLSINRHNCSKLSFAAIISSCKAPRLLGVGPSLLSCEVQIRSLRLHCQTAALKHSPKSHASLATACWCRSSSFALAARSTMTSSCRKQEVCSPAVQSILAIPPPPAAVARKQSLSLLFPHGGFAC